MKSALDTPLFYKQAIEEGNGRLETIDRCMVFAPHPDDETLGCGGLIATLRQAHRDVRVIFTTDGSMSHPNSRLFPIQRRIAIRKKEAISALAILGVAADDILFLNGKDSKLPGYGMDGYSEFAQVIQQELLRFDPQLILVPYKLDPHCDHRSTWQLVNSALDSSGKKVMVWEYPIWLYELAAEGDIPQFNLIDLKYVNIEPFLELKKAALGQHKSQITNLINDDPKGFILEPNVISYFMTGCEYFIERRA
ncbi:MAG: PIG-L family deacetylase [Mucilaginibacter polytrichastri]|nr:PIG-L family deacetylase [Mucilaginibacter polytrichastri]